MVGFAPHYTRKARGNRGRTARAPRSRRPVDLAILSTYYDGISGFQANTAGLEGYATTYGEMIPEGIRAMDAMFQQHSPIVQLPPSQRTFYDLGCGVGKIVIGMALLHPEFRSRGYEIVQDRVAAAGRALERVKQRGVAQRISFHNTSFLAPEVSLADAGWIYVSNLCFDTTTQENLATKMTRECQVGTAVACSREFPFQPGSGWTHLGGGHRVPMSWSSDSTVHLYRRDHLRQDPPDQPLDTGH